MDQSWRIGRFLVHQFFARHYKGRGIHSPYLFEFVQDVLFNGAGTDLPDWLVRAHRELRSSEAVIPQGRRGPNTGQEGTPGPRGAGSGGSSRGAYSGGSSRGAGSRVKWPEGQTAGSFVRRSSVSPKYGALLYRISRWFRPETIVEHGTGLGVSTMYLAAGSPGIPLHSVEGDTERAALAAQLVCRHNLEKVSIHWGDLDRKIEEILPIIPGRFLAFLDANHRYEPTCRYAGSLLERAGEEAILVMDDIYWSREMYRAWKEVISWPGVRMSIDLFHMGILLLRRDLNKTHVKINF